MEGRITLSGDLPLKRTTHTQVSEHYDFHSGLDYEEYCKRIRAIEPNKGEQIYYISYTVRENSFYKGDKNRSESLDLHFGDDKNYSYELPPIKHIHGLPTQEESQLEIRKRFGVMAPILKQRLMDGMSKEARDMLEKILSGEN